MTDYNLELMRGVQERLRSAENEGIAGVVRIDAPQAGPTLGITLCTHGNEPSGLAVAHYLLDEIAGPQRLQSGTLYVVLNNIRASDSYFSATSIEEKRRARFVDLNMNRLPEDLHKLDKDNRYEILRARQLYPIWQRFDVGFDVHSTTQDIEPMIISGGRDFHADLWRGFPIEVVLSNIDVVQIGLPAFGFYGKKEASVPVFEIEAGSHENPASFDRAIICARALLENLGMVPRGGPRNESTRVSRREYYIDGSIIFPNTSYQLDRVFKDFEYVRQGTVLARGNGPDMTL